MYNFHLTYQRKRNQKQRLVYERETIKSRREKAMFNRKNEKGMEEMRRKI